MEWIHSQSHDHHPEGIPYTTLSHKITQFDTFRFGIECVPNSGWERCWDIEIGVIPMQYIQNSPVNRAIREAIRVNKDICHPYWNVDFACWFYLVTALHHKLYLCPWAGVLTSLSLPPSKWPMSGTVTLNVHCIFWFSARIASIS